MACHEPSSPPGCDVPWRVWRRFDKSVGFVIVADRADLAKQEASRRFSLKFGVHASAMDLDCELVEATPVGEGSFEVCE